MWLLGFAAAQMGYDSAGPTQSNPSGTNRSGLAPSLARPAPGLERGSLKWNPVQAHVTLYTLEDQSFMIAPANSITHIFSHFAWGPQATPAA